MLDWYMLCINEAFQHLIGLIPGSFHGLLDDLSQCLPISRPFLKLIDIGSNSGKILEQWPEELIDTSANPVD